MEEIRAHAPEVPNKNHLCVRMKPERYAGELKTRGTPNRTLKPQFFGGGGGAEIAPVDAAMSSTARRKLFHFVPPTWSEFA